MENSKQQEKWNNRLKDAQDQIENAPEGTPQARLRKSWQALVDSNLAPWRQTFVTLNTPIDTPLSALFSVVAGGQYPSPEILAALLAGWREYMAAKGKISLEAALIGPVMKRAGNYAARNYVEWRMQAIDTVMLRRPQKGSQTYAVNTMLCRLGLGNQYPYFPAWLRGWRAWYKKRRKRAGLPEK